MTAEVVNSLLKTLVEGTIFSVTFIKRTTGEVRDMQCRFGVTSHLKGGGPAYDPNAKDLIWVFDVQKAGYRSIPIEGIIRIVGLGKTIFENIQLEKTLKKPKKTKKAR